MPIQDSLLQLRNKLQLLLKQHILSQKIIASLKNENTGLKAQLAKKQEEIERLEAKISTINISGITQNPDSKKDLEKRINGYLKEIDKCLSLLNN
ncbi:MAG: hypothetical protein LH478_14055 [Chitinophagaceae bacterium]|nr:hypothetical protein [Chitinophagaceae bacterium]